MNLVIYKTGDKHWFNDKGECHNIIVPASIYHNGDYYRYRHGFSHRLDGPASSYSNREQYWWLGECISQQHHTLLSNIRFFTRRVKI